MGVPRWSYTADMRMLSMILCSILGAQNPTGSVTGIVRDYQPVAARAVLLDHNGSKIAETRSDADSSFRLENIPAGSYVLWVQPTGRPGSVKSVTIVPGKNTEAGHVLDACDWPESGLCDRVPVALNAATPVVTVCEALRNPYYREQLVVIVGIVSPGERASLRQTCAFGLSTGDVVWPNEIVLTGALRPAKELAAQIKRKEAAILAGEPQTPRSLRRRIAAFYGMLLAPSNLRSIDCRGDARCNQRMPIAPAELVSPGRRYAGLVP